MPGVILEPEFFIYVDKGYNIVGHIHHLFNYPGQVT